MADYKTLVQRIALDGGKEIKKELEALGDAGVKAFKSLQNAAEKAKTDSSAWHKLTSGISNGFKNLAADMQGIRGHFDKFTDSINTVGERAMKLGVALGAVGTGFFMIVKSAADAADAQDKAAQKAGMSIETFSGLQWAFEQDDVALEDFVKSMGKFSKLIDTDPIYRNRELQDILYEVADRFAAMPDGVHKSAIAMKLFGKAGQGLIPVLNGGSKKLKEMQAEAQAMGITFTKAQAVIGDDFGDSLGKMTRVVTGLKNQFGLMLAPSFTEGFNSISEGIIKSRKQLLALAQALADKLKPSIEDFFQILRGEASTLREGPVKSIYETMVSVGDGLVMFFAALRETFAIIESILAVLIAPINAIFGTDFKARAVAVALAVGIMSGAFKALAVAIALTTRVFWKSPWGRIIALLVGVIALIKYLNEKWPEMGTVAKKAMELVKFVFSAVWEAIKDVAAKAWDSIKKSFWDGVDAVKATGAAIIQAFIDTVSTLIASIGFIFVLAWETIKQLLSDGWDGITATISGAWSGILNLLSAGWAELVEVFAVGNAAVADAVAFYWDVIKRGFSDGWAALKDTVSAGLDGIASAFMSAFTGIRDFFVGVFDALVDAASSAFGKVIGLAQRLIEIVSAAVSVIKQMVGAASPPEIGDGDSAPHEYTYAEPYAGGGRIRGAGTGTSDSILIRASNGEYMLRAAAVRHYGTNLLDAINSLRLPRSFFKGFAEGGLVAFESMRIPGFAMGGAIGSTSAAKTAPLRPLMLQLGNELFSGLLAPVDVADKLESYATARATRSAGRKPGWYK